jgi:hypothetical protein
MILEWFDFTAAGSPATKKGSVLSMDMSDHAREKKEGYFTTKEWRRVWRQRNIFGEDCAAFILFWFVRRSN